MDEWAKKSERGTAKVGRFRAQMDVQQLPALEGKHEWEYKISVIHLATRMKYSEIHPHATTKLMAQVLTRARDRLPPFFILSTDNALYFTMRFAHHAHRKTAFEKQLALFHITHTPIPPRQPWCNAFIERSNRTDNVEFFHRFLFTSADERRYYFRLWEDFYNYHRPHQSLDLDTPATTFHRCFPAVAASRLPALS